MMDHGRPLHSAKVMVGSHTGCQDPRYGEEVDKGLLKLGGCLVEKDNPDLFCKACENEWVK